MNRSEVLHRSLRLTGTSQTDLSRMTGVPQGRISQYVNGTLEPSDPMLTRLLSPLGVSVSIEVKPIDLERTKQRSWRLHRQISLNLGRRGVTEGDWRKMDRNLEQVRRGTRGQPHGRNMDTWQRIIDERDVQSLHRVLTDTSSEGIEMREVSPMAGFLTEDERRSLVAVPS